MNAPPDAEATRDDKQHEASARGGEHVGGEITRRAEETDGEIDHHERDEEDEHPHRVVKKGIERRGPIEVARHPTPTLQVDERHLDQQAPSRERRQFAIPPPPRELRPHPPERQARQAGGDAKQDRLPPGHRPLPGAPIDSPHHHMCKPRGDEEGAEEGQRAGAGIEPPAGRSCGGRFVHVLRSPSLSRHEALPVPKAHRVGLVGRGVRRQRLVFHRTNARAWHWARGSSPRCQDASHSLMIAVYRHQDRPDEHHDRERPLPIDAAQDPLQAAPQRVATAPGQAFGAGFGDRPSTMKGTWRQAAA